MAWSIEPLPLTGDAFKQALRVYHEAFSRPPYNDRGRVDAIRRRILETHAFIEGFQAFAAVHTRGDVIGMIYGYQSAPGQWWHDAVAAAIDGAAYNHWMRDAYELVEVAVLPTYQSLGVGRALIRALLEPVAAASCVLSTRSDSRAQELYGRLGFETIVEMRFSPGGYPFLVMGKELPGSPSA
jgi:ribosomal protein S18 acetylase RimI-like enzyme